MKGIRYIGKKATKEDNVAGTGLVWEKDQIHVVSDQVAMRLIRHKDIFELVDIDDDSVLAKGLGLVMADGSSQTNAVDDKSVKNTSHDLPNLHGMTKEDLTAYAQASFNHTFNPSAKKDEMVQTIISLQTAANNDHNE